MIPYAPTSQYRPNNRLSDLLLRAAEDQAEGHRRSGQIWGGAVAGLGNIAANAVEQHQEQKAMSRRDEAVAQLWESSQGNPDPKDLVRIYGPKEGMALANNLAQFNAAKANPRQDALSRFPAVAGIMAKIGPQLQEAFWNNEVIPVGQAAGIVSEPIPWKPGIEKELLGGFMPEGPAPTKLNVNERLVGPDGKVILDAVEKPEEAAQPRVVGRSLVGPDGKVIYRDPESRPTGSDNKIWVMRPGKDGKMQTVFVPESQVQPGDQPANTRSGEGRPSLGGEKSALGFFNRAKQADEELRGLTQQIAQKNLGGQAWMALAPNFLQTQEGQAYQQAQRAFTEARLRKDSGAAIPETEFANDRKTYFAQPGDSAETIAQKERGRAAVLASLAFQSGRALNEFYGDEAEPLLEGFKTRQVQPKAKPKPGPGASSGIITTPDGKKWKNIGGRMVEQK